jgi:PAS domain-containing protein
VATATLSVVAFYICPNCKERSIDTDGLDSLLDSQAVGCHHCGFGFLFELMEDYYPAPTTGLIVCDQQGRILGAGRGVFELTGYPEGELMGNDVVERLGLSGYDDGKNPVALALEWGVRRMGEKLVLVTRSGQDKSVTADIFPAYDADGGLLVALTPR